eukprot:3182224-Amphidinium_carterae.1
MADLKRVARYLHSHRCLVNVLKRQSCNRIVIVAMGFMMRSRLADFGIKVGTLVTVVAWRSFQTLRLHELSLNAWDWDDRNTSMSGGCGFKTICQSLAESTVESVSTVHNVEVAKPVASTTMNRHLENMNFAFRQSWSTLHRKLEGTTAEVREDNETTGA